ncbi:hypothetical protein C8J42_10778 [Sphingomonas sp. PP-CE-1A-559]|jgi:hypothetical protein|nr:hypothetical protein C8J42_10778 [Sphingomonas sp. PP-CE-1A-559]
MRALSSDCRRPVHKSPREGGGVRSAFPKHTTPAKAGAQLGDVANDAQFAVTATFPIGPRPPPGWCIWIGKD